MLTSRTRRRIIVASSLVAAFVLPMLPPAFGVERVPATVLRSKGIRVPAPLNPRLDIARTPHSVRAPEDAWTHSNVVCSDITFTSVGLSWRQSGEEEVDVLLAWGEGKGFGKTFRTRSDPDHSPDAETGEPARQVGTPPVWTGEARCLRYSLELPAGEDVRGLEVVFINTSGTAHGRSLLGMVSDGFTRAWRAWAGTPAQAQAPKPAIISRAGWGANESLRNCGPHYADRLKMAYVHHTATGNSYSRAQADDVVRSIYAFHTRSRGFCDIAYNFLVDRFGRIYEGRAGGMTRPVIGAHAQGFNTGSTGVALIGNFQTANPTRASIRATKRVLAWRLDVAHLKPTGTAIMTSAGGSNQKFRKGQAVKLPVISGHRQTGFTSCPGDHLWKRLGAIRKAALNRGLPKIWNPARSAGSIELGRSEVRFTATLSSQLAWGVSISRGGSVVRSWTGRGQRVDVTWDGLDQTGFPADEGTHKVTVTARVPGGASARPAAMSIRLTGSCESEEVLCGTPGNDVIPGGSGNEILLGFGGHDRLMGGGGNDLLIGGPGNDELEGGSGNDALEGSPGNDSLNGGSGSDTASFTRSGSRVIADLATRRATGEGSDNLQSVERLMGSRFGDRLLGNGGSNVLTGGGGNDALLGRGANDLLWGGPGNDVVSGGPGNDILLGGPGNDTASYRTSSRPVRVNLKTRTAAGEGGDRLGGIRNVIGSRFGDVLLGDPKRNRLAGRGGADRVIGRRGRDVLLGGPGADELRGGPGKDVLRGGPWKDVLRGGGGPDVLVGGSSRDAMFGGGGGDLLRARDRKRDLVNGGRGRDRAIVDRVDRVRGVERVR